MELNIENIEAEERRELLNTVTQKTRFKLIQTILAHPEQLPSLKEIAYATPSKSTSTIRGHLNELQKVGVIEEVKLPKEQQRRDLPRKFYGVTTSGRQFLADHDLLNGVEAVRGMYEHMEKTDKIKQYEEAPRPSDSRGGDGSASERTTLQH